MPAVSEFEIWIEIEIEGEVETHRVDDGARVSFWCGGDLPASAVYISI